MIFGSEKMILTYFMQMIKLTRAHIGVVVLPSFWLGCMFALLVGYSFNLSNFLIGFLIIFFLYASASYINDYYDFKSDQYNRQFGFSGGSGVLQQYPQLKKTTKNAAIGLNILALLLTIYLAWTTILPIWAIGFVGIGIFFSYFYSAPPIQMAYKGIGEFPHFIAGIMNTSWGYMLITGFLDLQIIIFSIPLSIHLLTVILLFEIPDREADIHGGKQNFIVNHGRKKSFRLITILFWSTTMYYTILSLAGWYDEFINFWLIAAISLVPSLFSTYFNLKSQFVKMQATKMAIKTALSLFTFSTTILVYFIILQF